MKNKILTLFVILLSFLQTGCFDWLNKDNKATASTTTISAIGSAQFTGVTSAVNKVTGILITWPSVSDSSLAKAYNVYRVTGTKKTLLTTLAPSMTSYIDGTVIWGTIYSYQVKAVDQNDIEDSNTKTVKAVSWAGIGSVTASSRTSLIVTFSNLATVVDEVRVYGQLGVGGTKNLLATGSGSDTEIEITGLRKGYPYIISAQAYVSSLGKEDGNDVTFSTSTLTVGYDADGSDTAQWGNVMQVRAFGEAPAAPSHPSNPEKSPSGRVVELSFNAFSSTGSSAKYVVTRAVEGYTLDSSSASTCTDTTNTSCRACSNVTASDNVVTCRDTAVAASPTKYRYSLSLIQEDSSTGDTWIEALPTDEDLIKSFSVLVPIPPKNMVLVQRDAANYEMCAQLNKSPDPTNHNRCLYSGVGAVPYSSGHNKSPLNLPTGYYDFGYNLFVDRWPMACNWTMASQGGMCGANHTSGDCIGSDYSGGTPSSSVGKVGDVWLRLTGSSTSNQTNLAVCFVAASANSDGSINWAYSGTMVSAPATYPNASTQLKNSFTSDPAYYDVNGTVDLNRPGKRGKTNFSVNAVTGDVVCKGNIDSDYGQKRLPRVREHVIYEAPPIITGEFYSLGSYANFVNKVTVTGGPHPNSYSIYGCDYGQAAAYDTFPASISQMLDYSLYPQFNGYMSYQETANSYYYGGIGSAAAFAIGAKDTVDCQSRYGVQDIQATTITSDFGYWTQTTRTFLGMMSPYDNGNRDLLSDISGGTAGYSILTTSYSDNSSASVSALSYSSSSLTAFAPPLALPIVSSSFSSDYLARAQISQPYGLAFYAPLSTASSGTRAIMMRRRWTPMFNFAADITSGYNNGQIRCVLPAE